MLAAVPNTLDRNNPLPLWAQLAADLRRRISAGEFPQRMPTDFELTDEYDVSRHTVREALRRLQDDGVVERRQGSGTYLRDLEFEQPLNELYSLFRSVESKGIEQRSMVLVQDQRAAPDVAARLGLPERRQFFYLERIRMAGGLPIAIDRAYLPLPEAAPLLHVDFRHTALYDELGRLCGIQPDRGIERLQPVMPTDHDRAALNLSADHPALHIERITSMADRPIEYRSTIVRGDRYSFRVEWDARQRRHGTPAVVTEWREQNIVERSER